MHEIPPQAGLNFDPIQTFLSQVSRLCSLPKFLMLVIMPEMWVLHTAAIYSECSLCENFSHEIVQRVQQSNLKGIPSLGSS